MTKYKITIVENDEDEQFFMKEAFENAGLFDVLAMVRNGNILFDWLKESEQLPDIILTDLNMPGKNGFDILQEVTETPRYAHIPVIITSTSSTPSIIEKCMARGAADYLIKPETFIAYGPYVEELYKRIGEKALVK